MDCALFELTPRAWGSTVMPSNPTALRPTNDQFSRLRDSLVCPSVLLSPVVGLLPRKIFLDKSVEVFGPVRTEEFRYTVRLASRVQPQVAEECIDIL
jgi:hypothetical protein